MHSAHHHEADDDTPHVLVVGAGFGGLTAARELGKAARHRPLRVTLLDRRNHHTFQPLLYQVATSGLQPQDVGHPLRPIFGAGRFRRDASAVHVRYGDAVDVHRDSREVELADGERIAYDHLVVAAGAVTSDFGIEGVEEHGFPLKSLAEALALRDHVLRCFESVDSRPSAIDEGALTFVVAGGGPTGVELSGAIAELVDGSLRRDYPHLDVERVRVVLVEMADRLLPGFAPASSEAALAALRRRGVEVELGVALERATEDHVELDDGRRIDTHTLVWVAGITAAPLGEQLGADTVKGGRVEVTDHLALPDDDRVHVIGDVAAVRDDDGELLPQLAPVAIQQGEYVVDQVVRAVEGRRPGDGFSYFDKGTMATIGRNDAVAELPFGLKFHGLPAWLAWLGLHLLFLVGFRNRVAVLFSWIWNYVTYDRSARLILHRSGDGGDRRAELDVGA